MAQTPQDDNFGHKHMDPPKAKHPSQPANEKIENNPGTHVKKLIAVISGKGGVGKSSVSALCALHVMKKGLRTAILDADITGPSIPRMFGLGPADIRADSQYLYPAQSATGIKVMSMNLLMEKEEQPVVWRSPVITGAMRQFWTDVVWGDVDYMFVDMPPGTGDIPLTLYQAFPLDGIIIVATPQELVEMIVQKAVNMARMMNIPILGLIENMSWMPCPHCGEKIYPFGESGIDEIAAKENLPVLAKLPIDSALAKACDEGTVEYYEGADLSGLDAVL